MHTFSLFFIILLFSINANSLEYKTTNLSVNNSVLYAEDGVLFEGFAPKDLSIFNNKIKLPIILRLSNNSTQTIRLTKSTPCAVFSWHIINSQHKSVQSIPNRMCIQMIVTAELEPNKSLERNYNIILNANDYVVDSNYRLMYDFWKYSGMHSFKIISGTSKASPQNYLDLM